MKLDTLRFLTYTLVIFMVAFSSVVVAYFVYTGGTLAPAVLSVFTVTIAGALSIQVFFFTYIISRNPSTFAISLLGFPGTGKTVYLTILFDELQRGHARGIEFRPSGQESSERVATNLNNFTRGQWLPPTEPGTIFPYRADAVLGGRLIPRRYKLEIADFAGESMKELNPTEEQWLHKTKYFSTVVKSEGIFFALDSQALLSGDIAEIEKIQNAFITALNVLIENKADVGRVMRLNVPLALLFLKADVLRKDKDKELVLAKVAKLREVCKARSRNFAYYFVSSTGPLTNEKPPAVLRPEKVTEPVVWMLERASSISFLGRSSELPAVRQKGQQHMPEAAP